MLQLWLDDCWALNTVPPTCSIIPTLASAANIIHSSQGQRRRSKLLTLILLSRVTLFFTHHIHILPSAGILQSVSESQERLNSFEKKQRDHPTGKDLSVIRYGTWRVLDSILRNCYLAGTDGWVEITRIREGTGLFASFELALAIACLSPLRRPCDPNIFGTTHKSKEQCSWNPSPSPFLFIV